MATKNSCRLCNGSLSLKFTANVLNKYQVKYWQCEECHSLQTDLPFWLEEAYATTNIASSDTGAVQRNLNNLAVVYFITKVLHIENIIDIGGGDGLLCRMLRDYGLNCFVEDKHAIPTYAQHFISDGSIQAELILGFEVVEHFSNPSADIEKIFSSSPKYVLLSTHPYQGQGSDWWYLGLNTGQHVFFYSNSGMQKIAEKYGYHLITYGTIAFFFQSKLKKINQLFIRLIIIPSVSKYLKGVLMLFPTTGVLADHSKIAKGM